jgi:NADH-quinone oxidoreductase subunit G
VLHTAAGRVAGLDLGLLPGDGGRDVAGILAGAQAGEIDLVWLLGADEIDTARLGSAFVVYQGHHGDRGAHRADVVLPGAAYTEKDALWVNLEGRVQLGRRANFPPGDAREDWTILRAFSDMVGKRLPYDSIGGLRRRMAELAPHFAHVDEIVETPWGEFGRAGPMERAPFETPIRDFYLTNPICRASVTMAECSRIFGEGRLAAVGAHG